MTRANAMTRLPPEMPTPSFPRARTPNRGSPRAPGLLPETTRCVIPLSWKGIVATLERIPPPKPRRDQDELHQASRPILDVERLRQAGRRNTGLYRRPKPLHRSWQTRHRGRRINPFGERGSSILNRFMQQSLPKLHVCEV